MGRLRSSAALAAFAAAISSVSPASAADGDSPTRWRVGLGAQLIPMFPGSDDFSVRPLVDVSRARGDEPFAFESADESFGFSLTRGAFGIGPAVTYEGPRKAKDIDAPLDKVKGTLEVGGFIQYGFGESFRIRAEARKGLGGHDAWIGNVGADYIARDGDAWLFAIGPRVTMASARYQRAYFGVTPAESVATGLATYRPDGGVSAVGGIANVLFQLNDRWGVSAFAKYDRLVRDAGRSPVVRELGSRDQFSGGLGLTYTFGGGTR